jgi:hypothetical protein
MNFSSTALKPLSTSKPLSTGLIFFLRSIKSIGLIRFLLSLLFLSPVGAGSHL